MSGLRLTALGWAWPLPRWLRRWALSRGDAPGSLAFARVVPASFHPLRLCAVIDLAIGPIARASRLRAEFERENGMANSQGRFVWYELMTTDVAAAKAFYAKVVGWGTEDASTPAMPYALFTVKGASVGGVLDLPEVAIQVGEKPRWVGYVGVDDVDAAAVRTKKLGGTVYVPPCDIPNVSRFSVVADPQEAMFALVKWLRPRREPPAEPNAPGRIGWHELLADDLEKALPFYSELFGWQEASTEIGPVSKYQLFAAAGQTIGGMMTKLPTVPLPCWLHYFNVSDIDAAASRVMAGGGQILEGPVEVPGYGWIVECVDPQGAVFGLEGKRRSSAVGYFVRGAPQNPVDTRSKRWNW